VAGTLQAPTSGDRWVCYDCAYGIDPELAEFAIIPERYQHQDHTPVDDESSFLTLRDHHWGVCPVCGRPADRWFNVRASHWLVCLRHGFRWRIGANLFSYWKTRVTP
jgi:hypothetical protein